MPVARSPNHAVDTALQFTSKLLGIAGGQRTRTGRTAKDECQVRVQKNQNTTDLQVDSGLKRRGWHLHWVILSPLSPQT